MLPGQLSVLEVILEEKEISCFDDILLAMTKMSKPEGKLVQEVQTISKLLTGNLFSSTAGERSFSSAQRLKTWLTPRMGNEKV